MKIVKFRKKRNHNRTWRLEDVQPVSAVKSRFDDPGRWLLYGSDISIAAGQLVAGSSVFTSPRGAKVLDASGIEAGRIYLVKTDITALAGAGIAWALTVTVGGAGNAITSAMTPAQRAALIIEWRDGILVTAAADGSSDNTKIEFFGTPIGLGGGCWGSVTAFSVVNT